LSPGEMRAVEKYFDAKKGLDDQEIILDITDQLEVPELSPGVESTAARRRRWRVG
jgi:hypothetical protein